MGTSKMSSAESKAWTLALTEVLGTHRDDVPTSKLPRSSGVWFTCSGRGTNRWALGAPRWGRET